MSEDQAPPQLLHFFGIRHHGPGCARSLLRALRALRPDCLLVEGPPEGEALLPALLQPGMEPPVALLSYCPDEPGLAVYHPFAEFSPEWQALRWAQAEAVPARFIDLPLNHALALDKAERDAAADPAPAEPPGPEGGEAEEAPHRDPLHWLARAAGYADGEAWWNHMVEERGDGEQLFAAIDEAMCTLRAEGGERPRSAADAQREALREAHMRQCLRAAQKEGFRRIAVVCGAWHLGGLRAASTAKADQALLKDSLKSLPKLKVQSTWVPWTYGHLTRASGYGAGIASPGWYEHLWRSAERESPRAIGWLTRVARLMRERDLDCSSAHLIEAARLADSLAALRDRPAPGLDELHEATRAVLTLGDDALLRYIDAALVVGDRLGRVPDDVPTVPLQRELEQLQKSLRLKPEALEKTLDLDLRQPNDLARSRLLHRLNLLDLPWGRLGRLGRGSRGSFHEVWTLQWRPEFALRLIEASQWGQTLPEAATARAALRAAEAADLGALSALVDAVLLADLPDAVTRVSQTLEDRAAHSADAAQLMAALPPLANVFRYGNVRQTDAAMVGHVLDRLILRAALSLPLACGAIDEEAAERLRDQLLAAHAAVGLRQGEAQSEAWRHALGLVAAQQGSHELLQGLCTRLLLDEGVWSAERAGVALSLHLSVGTEPARAAAWLDGFLNRNALVLLHDATVWRLVDGWLTGLSEEHFLRVLPLVRRSFAAFGPGERRDLGQLAGRGPRAADAAPTPPAWDEARAALPLPLLRQLLGMPA
ncbi:hypothetical protein G8A07_00255 [Roseateles sp. DAIF2]|uniref:DUF5682 family protein n=1 Tax=Roseateles sp. DAIF2 TaxID=2714952 RepID=UPI0018A314E2|nr:DUF5682 family protein [Roseateles sp. DAIF2]QPF71503.1 hypothetical protein G8A07_00255 [Roseateles sp. DAIF2]